ncbi:hypothetical protein chiPu_0029530, partial [Chiloscyllium punctatum]|nr:hypothetical protein [Chiloscyllium punctatum]
MNAIDLREGADIEACERAQDHQRGEALPVRRTLDDVMVMVARRDRLHIIRGVRREIVAVVGAAEATQDIHHLVGGLARVERVAAVLRDPAQGPAERRLRTDVANLRHLAAGKELGRRVAVDLDPRPEAAPILGNARRDAEALLGSRDRRPEDLLQRLAAVIGDQPAPCIDRAGHGHSLGRGRRNVAGAASGIFSGVGAGRCAAGTVERDRRAGLRRIECEAVAADPGHLRLDHALHRDRRHRGIDGIAAGLQHLDRGKRCLRMRGRGHAALRNRHRTA